LMQQAHVKFLTENQLDMFTVIQSSKMRHSLA